MTVDKKLTELSDKNNCPYETESSTLNRFLPYTTAISKCNIEKTERKVRDLIIELKNNDVKKEGEEVYPYNTKQTFEILKIVMDLNAKGDISLVEANELLYHVEKIEDFYRMLKNKHQYHTGFFKSTNAEAFLKFEEILQEELSIFTDKNEKAVKKNRTFISSLIKFTHELLDFLVSNVKTPMLKSKLDSSRTLVYSACLNIVTKDYYDIVYSEAAQIIFYGLTKKKNVYLTQAREDLEISEHELVVFRSHLVAKTANKLNKIVLDKLSEQLAKNSFMDDLAMPKNDVSLQDTLYNEFLDLIKRNKTIFYNETSKNLDKSSLMLIDRFILTSCKDTLDYTFKSNDNKTKSEIIMLLPDNVADYYHSKSCYPSLIQPTPWDLNGEKLDVNFKRVSILPDFRPSREHNVILSQNGLESYNIIQNKCYKINKNFDVILKELDKNPNLTEYDIPFPRLAELVKVGRLLREKKIVFSPNYHTKILKNCFLSFEKRIYVETGVQSNNIKNINTVVGLGIKNLIKRIALKKIRSNYQSLYNKRQLFQTHILFAELYKNSDYFFDLFIDYRGRNYPIQYLFSRTIGYLKYYSKDSNPKKLTISGLITMLKNYYDCSLQNLILFENFIMNKNNLTLDSLYSFFLKTKVSHEVKNQTDFLYFYFLEKELFLLKENKFKTSFLIERDMKSSGPTFLAMLFRNNHLGIQTNLVEKTPNDFTQFLMANTRSFFNENLIKLVDNKVKKTNADASSFLSNPQFRIETRRILNQFEIEKSLSKKAAMFFFYGQRKKSRSAEWKNFFNSNMKLGAKEEKWLDYFAEFYLDFLSALFPGFKQQFQKFQKCFEYFFKYSSQIELDTADGTKFIYTLFITLESTSSRYDVLKNKKQNYKRKIVLSKKDLDERIAKDQALMNELQDDYDKFNSLKIAQYRKGAKKFMQTQRRLDQYHNAIKQNRKSLFQSFLANFTHMIDSTFIRIITKRMFDKEEYILGNIHDCLMLHPNLVSSLEEEILKIFSEDLNIDLEDLFFVPSLKYLEENYEDQKIIEDYKLLIHNFKSAKGNLEIIPENILVKNIFPNEHMSKQVANRNR